jgi:hypothetical protein
MNNQIESKLLKFKENNINNLDIYLGSYLNNNIFNKKIDTINFNTILDILINKNYIRKKYNIKLYNYGIHYLEQYSTKYCKKTNISQLSYNTNLYITYLNTESQYSDFPCKKNYHIIEQNINEFKINDEIFIMVINNSQIKINITLNHNIDLSIKKLNELFLMIT